MLIGEFNSRLQIKREGEGGRQNQSDFSFPPQIETKTEAPAPSSQCADVEMWSDLRYAAPVGTLTATLCSQKKKIK